MLKDIKDKNFYINNYINGDQFNELYDSEWQTKKTKTVNAIIEKLILVSKKGIK